eukprot:1195247-Prorocentrum_minimum.AAC.3
MISVGGGFSGVSSSYAMCLSSLREVASQVLARAMRCVCRRLVYAYRQGCCNRCNIGGCSFQEVALIRKCLGMANHGVESRLVEGHVSIGVHRGAVILRMRHSVSIPSWKDF